MSPAGNRRDDSLDRVRFAVLGLGHIAQVAVLPAFRHARKRAELVALVSDDSRKLRELGERYGALHTGSYDRFERLLAESGAEAVYIALPNHLHADFTVRALRAGMHVLCEKPLAVTAAECERMIAASRQQGRKLMTAYRLHFEESNLVAIERVVRGELGQPVQIHATLTLTVRDAANIRLNPRRLGGGPLYDLGIYCINAGRYLFRAEPDRVIAFASPRSAGPAPEHTIAGMLAFAGGRLLTFTASIASAPVSEFRVIGTKGWLRVESAFDYAEPMRHVLTIDEKTRTQKFKKRDQFAAELLYFSKCVLHNREPEPSGREGLADVRIIEALYRSLDSGKAVHLPPFEKRRRPDRRQEIHRPPVRRPPAQVAAKGPSEP